MREEIGFELRGDYTGMNAEDMTVNFKWEQFTEEHHAMWRFLFNRIMPTLKDKACDEYMQGIEALDFAGEGGIPNYDRISDKLQKLSGWRLVTVPGLLPAEVFFAHLAKRQFPVTTFIRTPEEIDYLQEPDIFHDMFGHVPMIANPVFADYFHAFGEGAMKAMQHNYLPYLETLYWFTIEFGLINTPKGRRIYGAGISSSLGEVNYCLSEKATHVAYDVKRIMRQKYRIDTFQHHYFVIDSFEQLRESTRPDFLPYYAEVSALPPVAVEEVLATDTVFQRSEAHS
jgi:phenylalanine-4-hydroxylase